MAKLRAGSSPTFSESASVGCIVERPLDVFCQVLCRRRRRARVSGGRKNGPRSPKLLGSSPFFGESIRQRVGRGWHVGRVRRCQGDAEELRCSFFFLRTEPCFLDGFVETWVSALSLRFQSPAQGQTAAWKQSRIWPHNHGSSTGCGGGVAMPFE